MVRSSGKLGGELKHTATKRSMWIEGLHSPVKAPARQKDEVDSFLAVLAACAKSCNLSRGVGIHEDILSRGLVEECSDALISMYARCGELAKAKGLFDIHGSANIFVWNGLIASFVQMGQHQDALNYFEMMHHQGLSSNATTLACILKSCGSRKEIAKGEQIHDEIARQGLLRKNIVLGNALVTMYAKCGALSRARQVLDELPVRNVVSWNTLLAGYVEHGEAEKALDCFEQMQGEGLCPNAVTFTCILKACSNLRAADKGERIHDEIAKLGLLEDDIVLGTVLVSMYAKCGALAKARQVLEELRIRDVVAWTALITGYAEYGESSEALNCLERMKSEGLYPDAIFWTTIISAYTENGKSVEALKCYELMQRNGVPPDAATFACVLKACGNIGAQGKGEKIHDEITKQGLLESNLVLNTALVDMYANCGALAKAQKVLGETSVRDVVSWSAFITGLTKQGEGEQALNYFDQMQREGLCPDAAAFSCVLSACSRSGLVENAQTHLENMILKYGLMPDLRHYTSIVDVLGRVGHLNKAFQIIEKISSSDVVIWSALLGACQKWGDVNVGKQVFDRALQVE